MAKWKDPSQTEQITLNLTVDPRVRMKEIRAKVKAFLKGDTLGLAHLGDLPNTMEDARRVIIATQDLLEIERDKHRKATLHICELIHLNDEMAVYHQQMMDTIFSQGRQIEAMRDRMMRQEQEIQSLGKCSNQHRAERDAVLTTMKLERNMEAPAPMIVPQETFCERQATPQVDRGPVSLEQPLRNMAMGRAR